MRAAGPLIALTIGSVCGARGGAGMLARLDERVLKSVFGLFLVAVAVLMAVHFWRVRKDGGISGPL